MLSTKCAEEEVIFIVQNNCANDIVFTSRINFLSLDNLKKRYGTYDSFVCLIQKKSTMKFFMPEGSLNGYLSEDISKYKFYIIERIREQKIKDSTFFEIKKDSIVILREKIKIGSNNFNKFSYDSKKIIFLDAKD